MHVEHGGEDRGGDEHEGDERCDRDADVAPEASHAAGVLRGELRRVLRRVGRGLARDPEDHGTRDQEEEPGVALRPERGPREEGSTGHGEKTEPDQRPRAVSPVAQCRRGDRVLLALVGHDERRGGVDQDAGPAQEGEDDEADAEDGGVDLEVASKAATDAGNLAIRAAALQAPDLWDMCDVCVHV